VRILRLARPLDLRRTVGGQHSGGGDPTTVVTDREVWRASRTPAGPGTLHARLTGAELTAEAWGPGAEWLLDGVPALIGEHDEPASFDPDHPLVRDLHRRSPGLRIGRSGRVFDAVVPAILGQRVTSLEAIRQWRTLCRLEGEPAPGPCTLVLPPAPEALAERPYWWFHRLGVERHRADTLVRAARRASRLEEAATMSMPDAWARLQAVPGIGPWTAAEVAGRALGDPDAVAVGDYHLPNIVAFALAGEPRGDDTRMLELLEPFAGHRGRVLRLLLGSGIGPPKRGPRRAIPPIARW
jgi:3-methyladenine DNA glycosylase/8-oxoguanine DNA glycosylase